jgi:hypothetical protein
MVQHIVQSCILVLPRSCLVKAQLLLFEAVNELAVAECVLQKHWEIFQSSAACSTMQRRQLTGTLVAPMCVHVMGLVYEPWRPHETD